MEAVDSLVEKAQNPIVKKLWERCGFLQQAVENAEREIKELNVQCAREKKEKEEIQAAFVGAEAKLEQLNVQVEQLKVAAASKPKTTPQGSASSAVKALSSSRPQSARGKAQSRV